jgi:polyisoprenoid-binding protein YceI
MTRRSTRSSLPRKATWLIGVSSALVGMSGVAVVVMNHQLTANVPAPLSFSDAPALAQDAPAPSATPAAPGAAGRAAGTSAGAAGTAAGAARTSTVVSPPRAATASAAPSRTARDTTATAPRTATTGASASPVEGTWQLASSSVAGYRIGYTSPVGNGTRVGRTNAVTGTMTIKGSVVKAAQFSVDMPKVACDGGDTCTQHVSEIMDVQHHRYETFALTSPIDLGAVPPDGKQISTRVTGKLTLRGVTRTVTFVLTARRNSSRIDVLGSIPVNRDDYAIPDANEPGFHIDKDGTIELLLSFQRP